jgi:hydroxymethylpyrimidine pyrophosphatase-like HAD family hydrolase
MTVENETTMQAYKNLQFNAYQNERPSNILFASDLDNTLIYSYKAAKAGDICVEVKDGKDLSFMPPEAYALLKEVAGNVLFVPVTTRSLEQYRRINLGVQPKYAVVAHGAVLLVDGQIDEAWAAESKALISAPLPVITESGWIYDIRYVDNYFLFAKSPQPGEAVNRLMTMIDPERFDACFVHNKVYIFPKGFTKGLAIKRLRERLQPDAVISAGDSHLDVSMLMAADIAIAPASLEFHVAQVKAAPPLCFRNSCQETVPNAADWHQRRKRNFHFAETGFARPCSRGSLLESSSFLAHKITLSDDDFVNQVSQSVLKLICH